MPPHHLKPYFHASPSTPESPSIQTLISSLDLLPHIEGGFYKETDRALDTIPSPFGSEKSSTSDLAPQRPGFDPSVRNSSTTIFYLLTPNGPQGGFHRNKGRTVHTLHHGRGCYVLIHADEDNRVETFIVGPNVAAGEKLQWIVEGGKYKASFLLPDSDNGSESSAGLLISETVVPGFEFCDHDFLSPQGLKDLLKPEESEELSWLLSPLGKEQ
jgi:predicted cupin superfamily sugar epimerase